MEALILQSLELEKRNRNLSQTEIQISYIQRIDLLQRSVE